MVKNKSTIVAKSSKILVSILKIFEFTVIAAVAIVLFMFWYKPEIITQHINLPAQPVINQNNLKNQFASINKDIDILSKTITSEQEKFNLLQNNIDNLNTSKVDASEILSINNQLRTLENQIQMLAKTSNSGALLLNSAMLIKDSTLRNQNCKTEAEALKILAENFSSISEDVDFIYSHCSMTFLSDKSLIDNFKKIYEENNQPTIEKDWKKRITSKFNEYVKISTIKDKNNAQLYDKTSLFKKIKVFVDNNDLNSAIKEIEKQKEILENSDINAWYEQTKKQLIFYKSLSNIIATSLQVMKVENAKNNIEENSAELE